MPLIREPPQQHTYSSMRNQIILIYKTQPTQARKIQNSRHPRRKRTPKQNAAIVEASLGLVRQDEDCGTNPSSKKGYTETQRLRIFLVRVDFFGSKVSYRTGP